MNLRKAVIELIEKAVRGGDRCPLNSALPEGASGIIPALAREGVLRIELSGRDWRRVTMLKGELAGRSTAANPHGHCTWRVIDERGNRLVL